MNYQDRQVSSVTPDIAVILHLWSDLALVKINYYNESRILTRAVQGNDHFPASLAGDHIYELHFKSGKCLIPDRHSNQGASLREHPRCV